MIDVFSRFSVSTFVRSKDKNVIADGVLRHWVATFGTPRLVFSDNGGEFNNDLLRDVAELLGTSVATTAAESPWSNGVCERHNAVIGNMVVKIVDDTRCSAENALVWAVAAKNALCNNGGFSPNQLVFGTNPNLPSVLTAKPPALRSTTPSQLVAEHLNALHSARRAFVQSESCKKIKTALNHQTRESTSKIFSNGEKVYYKRNDSKQWRGPGIIVGMDGKIVLVKHGGSLQRVNPIHLRSVRDTTVSQPDMKETNAMITEEDMHIPAPVTRNSAMNDNSLIYVLDEEDMQSSTLPNSNIDGGNQEGVMVEHSEIVVEDANSIDILESNLGELVEEQVVEESVVNDKANSTGVSSSGSGTDVETTSDTQTIEGAIETYTSPLNVDTEPEINSNTDNPLHTPSVNVVHTPGARLPVKDIPNVRDRVRIFNPNTKEKEELIIIGRGGKLSGSARNKSYLNVKNVKTGAIGGVDFRGVEWTKLDTETVYNIENVHDVIVAQHEELESWKENNVYTEVEDNGQDVVTTRWVITGKTIEGAVRVKARLVARGFEEDTSDIKKDAPTVRKENLRLLCSLAVAKGWMINSVDIKSAFLQGFPIDRAVYILPPPEANTTKLWKLNTSVYGLCDAPRSFYNKVHTVFTEAGLQRSLYDHALFYMYRDNELQGTIGCHVDDFLNAGAPLFSTSVMAHIRTQLKFRSENDSVFEFIGLNIEQEGKEILIDQDSYIDTLLPIKLKDNESSRLLDLSESRKLKSFVGQLQWVAKHSRPDMSFSACELSTHVKNATVADVKKANKQLKHLQSRTVRLRISDVGDLSAARLVVFSDASHANLPQGASQGGFIVFIQGSNRKSCPLTWKSHKLKRVAKSPLAAETMALLEAAEHAQLVKTTVMEMLGLDSFPIMCVVDSKSLADAVHTSTTLEDHRVYIDICALREMVEQGEVTVKHVKSGNQLADCFTKGTSSPEKLLQVIEGRKLIDV